MLDMFKEKKVITPDLLFEYEWILCNIQLNSLTCLDINDINCTFDISLHKAINALNLKKQPTQHYLWLFCFTP